MDYTWILCLVLLLLQIILSKSEDVSCSVNNNITVEFTVDPPGSLIFWRRDGNDLRDVKVNAAGDGCDTPLLPDPAGYEFDCKNVNNMSVFNLKFKSKIEDNGLDFTLSKINPTPTFSYTAYTINGASNSHTDCDEKGKFEEELMCNVSCNCVKPSLSWKYTTEDQQERSINISDIEPVACGPGGDLYYKLDIHVKNSEIMKLLPDDVTGLVTVTGTLTIGDEIVPLSTTLTVNGSSSGEDCSWCIPVYVCVGVLVCVGICCIAFAIYKKKKREKGKKKPDRQDEATELKDPKIQQREGEIEKKQENH